MNAVRPIFREIRNFYDTYVRQRNQLLECLGTRADDRTRFEIAQLVLNRLIFLYFLQQKSLLDHNQNYLQEKLQQCIRDNQQFYTDFCLPLLFRALSEEGIHNRKCGEIPFLGVELFQPDVSELECQDFQLPNEVFVNLFDFLNQYHWTTTEGIETGEDFAVSPEVLGYIFEKNVNALSAGGIVRKASGAYYTPAIITAFMAEQAILPTIQYRVEKHLQTHFETFADLFDATRNPDVRLSCLYLFTEILPGFGVLDNACGSGAFLVAALQVLVRVWGQVVFPIIGESAVRDAILADSATRDSDGEKIFRHFDDIAIFMADATWRYYFTRRVMTHNLYGVDLEVGAVNTAKMRLWLSLIAEIDEKDVNIARVVPLPTLDAHLRSGNSLVGYITDRKHSGVSSLGKFLPRTDLMPYIDQLSTLYPIEGEHIAILAQFITVASIVEIRRTILRLLESAGDASEYQRLQSICKVLFPILDHHLGLTHLASITKQLPANAFLAQDDYFNLHPFHWIAEFPEVLIARGGFDVIVGNPPYISMKKQTLGQKAIYAAKYRAFHANGDMYYLFVERSFALLHPHGTLAYIIPRYFLKAPTATALKEFLAGKDVVRIYDFGQSAVFQGVGVHTLMLFAHPSFDFTDNIKTLGVYSKEDFGAFQGGQLSAEQTSFAPADLQQENWLFLKPAEQQIFDRIYRWTAGQLDEFCTLSKGLQTGKDEVFVINDATRVTYDIEQAALRPFLKGSGVQRFSINPPEPLFLIFSTSHQGDEVMSFPHAAAYLAEHRAELEDRTRVPAWYQWRLGDERVTLLWEKSKIVTASRGSENMFAIDRAGYYFSQDVTFIQPLPEFDPYLQYFLALLNSTVTRMLMRWQFKELAEDVYEIFPEQLRKISVKFPDPATLTRINVVMQEIENIAPDQSAEKLFQEVDAIIYNLYTGNLLSPSK